MFNSQCLLSKKGPLGTIWIAAHCLKRLKKDQVKQTDISSSVDRILHNEVEVVAYRILAYLLLGVVRIFSKKVDFLFHDCHDVMRNLKDFAGGRSADESIEVMRTPCLSITLPERFELDAFDLGVLIDQEVSSANVRASEELMLPDTVKVGEHSNDKFCWSVDNSFEAYSSIYTPVKDVFSDHLMDIDFNITPLHDVHGLKSSLENLHGVRFSLEERLEPMIFHEAEKESGVEMPSNAGCQTDLEQMGNHDTGAMDDIVKSFGEEESRDKLCGTKKIISNSDDGAKGCQIDEGQKKNLDSGINVVGPEKFNDKQNVEPEKMKFPEMAPLTDQITTKHPVSITIESKFTGGSGDVAPEFIAVRTPAAKECARVVKKRKCLFDDTVVLSNKVVKHSIDDSSDVVCKRRKAPHTSYHAWRAHKISNLPQSFLEPLIPWNLAVFRSLVQHKRFATRELAENAEIHVNEVIDEVPINQVLAESPVKDRSAEQTPIAPATPVTSLRLQEVRGANGRDILEPASSFESMEKYMTRKEDQDLDASLMDEEINSSAGDTPGKNECSARTRKVGRYLYEKFQDQRRQKGEMRINLTQVLKGKSRKESARLFYEILVLKTGDYIDVRQEIPFGDILVLEAPELKNTVDTDAVS
ncbi:unnamed protein product [Coffea canephora]|uniref:Rad21/Rec8-like protein N-terminal domain-containing protein n=1 Tax=Coffea canephora TaxID=49390 RepID=A0A068V7P9_COFCA|nr:unnamed protein product [Coffea canephora]